jgi:hypothetical protein
MSPMLLPSFLHDTWISAAGWNYGQVSAIRLLTELHLAANTKGLDPTVSILAAVGTPLCSIRTIDMAPVGAKPDNAAGDEQYQYCTECKPQPSMLEPCDMTYFYSGEASSDAEEAYAEFRKRLGHYLDQLLSGAIQGLSTEELKRIPSS